MVRADAPGRVNLIGEHTDYNGGFVLPIALEHTTRAAVGRRDDGMLALVSVQEPGGAVEMPLADLVPGTPDGWAGYPAGVVHELRPAVTAAGGLSVLVDSEVPVGAGLSSSAALEERPLPTGTAESTRASKPRRAWPSPRSRRVRPCT